MAWSPRRRHGLHKVGPYDETSLGAFYQAEGAEIRGEIEPFPTRPPLRLPNVSLRMATKQQSNRKV